LLRTAGTCAKKHEIPAVDVASRGFAVYLCFPHNLARIRVDLVYLSLRATEEYSVVTFGKKPKTPEDFPFERSLLSRRRHSDITMQRETFVLECPQLFQDNLLFFGKRSL
jgi:hypothetical protein